MRCMSALLFAFLVSALPAAAQQRVVVVPEAAGVVVPPRGDPGPRLVHAPRPRIAAPRGQAGTGGGVSRPIVQPGTDGILGGASGLAVPALILLPLAAAAYAATAVPGSGSGTSAPARTR